MLRAAHVQLEELRSHVSFTAEVVPPPLSVPPPAAPGRGALRRELPCGRAAIACKGGSARAMCPYRTAEDQAVEPSNTASTIHHTRTLPHKPRAVVWCSIHPPVHALCVRGHIAAGRDGAPVRAAWDRDVLGRASDAGGKAQ